MPLKYAAVIFKSACRVSQQHFQKKLWASIVAQNVSKPSDLKISTGRGEGWDLNKAHSYVEKLAKQSPSTKSSGV